MTDLTGLAEQVGEALLKRGRVLATAESCTGGWVAKLVTDVAGSSQWFDRGFVTYSNPAKQAMLGVSADTLARHGAVSRATAIEMARGALRNSDADLTVAVTGIAGPSGGTDRKPVGLVWYGLAWREVGQIHDYATKSVFPSGREMVRTFASHKALDLESLGREQGQGNRPLVVNLVFGVAVDQGPQTLILGWNLGHLTFLGIQFTSHEQVLSFWLSCSRASKTWM